MKKEKGGNKCIGGQRIKSMHAHQIIYFLTIPQQPFCPLSPPLPLQMSLIIEKHIMSPSFQDSNYTKRMYFPVIVRQGTNTALGCKQLVIKPSFMNPILVWPENYYTLKTKASASEKFEKEKPRQNIFTKCRFGVGRN